MFHIADEPDRIKLVVRSNNDKMMLLLCTEVSLVEGKDSVCECCGLIVTGKTWATWVFRVWDVFWKAVRFCQLRCHFMPANNTCTAQTYLLLIVLVRSDWSV